MLVCAHPDDETIGAGTRLPRLENVRLIHVTDGSPKDLGDALRNGLTSRTAYASVRRSELQRAMELADVSVDRLECIGIGDQKAARNLTFITRALYQCLVEYDPEFVITHPLEGGHPDHDATAFAVHAACRLWRRSGGATHIVEMTSYHNSAGCLRAGEFLDGGAVAVTHTAELTQPECLLKQAMFECFRTQSSVLNQFRIGHERFRPAPHYDFTQPPHAGVLYYEQHPWGLTGAEFRELARISLLELDLEESK